MFKGTILVDSQMKTSLDDVYAAGDCVMVANRITGKRQWSPMGSSANLEGRTLAQVLAGTQKTYPGVLGTRCSQVRRRHIRACWEPVW